MDIEQLILMIRLYRPTSVPPCMIYRSCLMVYIGNEKCSEEQAKNRVDTWTCETWINYLEKLR